MTNMDIDPVGILFILIAMALGILTIVYLIIWSVTNKQFDVMAGLLIFVLGTIFTSIYFDRSQDILSIIPAFGITATVTYAFSKNIRVTSAIAFTGTVFFIGFMLGMSAGTEGFYGPAFGFELYFLPRLLELLAITAISSMILYTYCKNIPGSVKGSLIGLAIISALLLITIFTFFKFGFNLLLYQFDSPLWIKAVMYAFIPIFTGVIVVKLTGCRGEVPQ